MRRVCPRARSGHGVRRRVSAAQSTKSSAISFASPQVTDAIDGLSPGPTGPSCEVWASAAGQMRTRTERIGARPDRTFDLRFSGSTNGVRTRVSTLRGFSRRIPPPAAMPSDGHLPADIPLFATRPVASSRCTSRGQCRASLSFSACMWSEAQPSAGRNCCPSAQTV